MNLHCGELEILTFNINGEGGKIRGGTKKEWVDLEPGTQTMNQPREEAKRILE